MAAAIDTETEKTEAAESHAKITTEDDGDSADENRAEGDAAKSLGGYLLLIA
ncbi:hypothetical protein [Streptomyces sp. NPDC050485]|uniref:hypothetical protein n=1 Tax=Streptomyces sp. NPDC050485 TaxID=3365617 RepID=UPI00379DE60C